MSPAAWHLLILWMTLVSCPRISTARFPYVSKFEYVPRLHPSRNPDCRSRHPRKEQIGDDFSDWSRPAIQVRAMLSPCSKTKRSREDQDRGSVANCTRKIVFSMKFNNVGKTETQEKFVIIDHVLDPVTTRKIPLQNPYVIKVRQEAVLQMYGLTFQSVVNAEAKEEVINNESPNYRGCNVDVANPTCGQTFLRGEPVPFSQGFCCSCEPKVNARHQSDGSNYFLESFAGEAKSSYNDGTNKPRNRLRTETEYRGLDDNPMARRQGKENEARSGKKSNTPDVDPDRGPTIVANDACRRKDASNKPLDTVSTRRQESKEASNLDGSSRTTEQASSPRVINSIVREKYSRNQADGSSTSVSSSSPEPASGWSPSGHKTANVSEKEAGKRDSAKSNRGSKKEVQKFLEATESDKRTNRSSAILSKDLRGSKKKATFERKTMQGRREGYTDRPIAKSTKKMNRTIGSLAIRPAMHLNEPLKNLSTGLSYGDRSSGQRGRTEAARERNLNSVMESTSSQPDIIVESFDEKHEVGGSGYFQSSGNEGSKRLTGNVENNESGLFARMPAAEEKMSLKKLLIKETVENYTPQKRTLKDLSFRDKYDLELKSTRNQLRKKRHFVHLRSTPRRSRTRGRRKRSREPPSKASGRDVQVYIGDFRASKDQKGKESDYDSHDNVDKQIEEKFSRISDALKEDAMGPRVISKKTGAEPTSTETANKMERNFHGVEESQNTFNEPNEASSRRRNNEAFDEPNETVETVPGENAEAFDGKVPQHRVESSDRSEGNEDIYGELSFSNQRGDQLADRSSTTIDSEQIVSPPRESLISSSFASVKDKDASGATKSTTEGSTQALIVIDVFKFATSPSVERFDTPVEEILKFEDRWKLDKTEDSKKSAEKAMIQSPEFRPVHRTFEIAETTPVSLTENATIDSTTVRTTLITDQTFRASIESIGKAAKQTSFEFHNEAVIDGVTFPDETVASTMKKLPGIELISANTEATTRKTKLTMGFPGRKKRRTTPPMIKSDLALRGERSLHEGKGDSSRPESPMQFSLETGNVDLVKEKMGARSSFLREQRNYLQLRVDGQGEPRNDVEFPSRKSRKRYRQNEDDNEEQNVSDDAGRGSDEFYDSKKIEWMHHPWFVRTEKPEFDSTSKGKPRSRESSSSQNAEDQSERILPPCKKNEDHGARVDRRGRRLLSVRRSKGVKDRSTKDRKKIHEDEKHFIKDQEQDSEDEENGEERRKRVKSVREKTQKRVATRSATKRKKEDKNRSKKQDYDYLIPEQQEYSDDGTFLEEKRTDGAEDSDEFLGNYEAVPALGETVEEDANDISKISQNSQDDSYDRSMDDSVPADLDKLAERLKIENEARSSNEGVGKDFEISLTGKIHLVSDRNGRPVSISFDAAPEYLRKDRFPSESANSFIDAGTDDANFQPDVLGGQPSLSAPFDLEDGDRSNAKESYSGPIRAGIRDESSESRRRRLLRLQKSVDASGRDQEEASPPRELFAVNGPYVGLNGNLNRPKKDSSNFIPEETEVEDSEESLDIDQDESSNIEDRNRAARSSNEDGLKKTANEPLIDAPQISIDLSDVPSDVTLASQDVRDRKDLTTYPGQCYVLNTTTLKIDLPETSTVVDETTIMSYQNTDVESNTTEVTSSEQLEDIATTIGYQEILRATTLRPKAAAVQLSTDMSQRKDNGSWLDQSKESIEKKNMLAVSEFVKKLEQLVTDAGNWSNETGHTLIHLKKFIIVPDNRTLWSVKELAEPERLEQSPAEEEVIAIGEGSASDKGSKDSLKDNEETVDPGDEIDRKSKTDNSNLIKEIISSVIRGDDSKRDVSSVESKDSKTCDGCAKKNSGSSVERREEASLNVVRNADNQFLENAKDPSKKDKGVCTENKSNLKEKRETSKNVNLEDRKGGKKSSGKRKSARHAKKAKRRKGKRKMKKRKWNKHKKENKKSKWPFKRNLLMFNEKEQDRTPRPTKVQSLKISRRNKLREPQIRGGQDCADHRRSPNMDPFKYLESAHCLRFSDLWYSVYRLEEPVIDHRVHLEIYEKHTSPDGSTLWKDLTNGSAIRLGTSDRRYRNREDTMALTYNDIRFGLNGEYNLDPQKDRLLVPSTLTGERSKYPESEGWSGEYLVVQADEINENANECDKAGVGFTAFAEQPDRCERVRGTCLKNQPLAYWRHDTEARATGRAGCYFLSNFAWVPSEAIKYNVNGTGSREFLALEYHSPHVSVIDVELRADNNALLRPGSSGRLTEVYADNGAIDYTVITVLITNKGSSLSSYRVRITDCPKGVPVSWLNAESTTKIISPHCDRKITLDLYGKLSLNEFSCSVELLNRDGEPVATRQIRVRKMERCFCVQHCACSCTTDVQGIGCQPISLENYHAAGFRGPIPTSFLKSFVWWSPIAILCLFWTALLLLLLLMGCLKWLIGLCVPAVSRWGLDVILATDRMNEYFEKDLKSRPIVFDQFGAPVHPDTGRKTVRICNRKLEFFLNLIFFFVYPFAICYWYCAKAHRSSPTVSSVESKTSLMSKKEEPASMVRVSTYGDGINSKMEAEDTRYVIDELKKSQESLQNHSRYKRSRRILTEHSSSD